MLAGLLGQAQVMFDRCLMTYHKHSRKRNNIDESIDLKEFRLKWADYVNADADDLRPLLGLDAYQAPPKPYKIHQKYDTTAIHR